MLHITKMLVTVVVLTSSVATLAAQPVTRTFRWGATVSGAAALQAARTYRLFENTDELLLSFTFFNQSSDSLSADLTQFAKGVQIRLRSDEEIPIETEWNSAIHLSGDSIDSPVGPIRLAAGTGFGWTVSIHRKDRATFTSGSYELTLSVADALRSLRENETKPWTGHAVEMTTLHISIAPPESNEERALMYGTSAAAAMNEHRPADAVRLFGLAVDAVPDDVRTLSGLGMAYLSLNRYREAISAYERALPLLKGERNFVAESLAFSYVAIGDEQNAARVLRLVWSSESDVNAQIRTLRDQVRRRAAR